MYEIFVTIYLHLEDIVCSSLLTNLKITRTLNKEATALHLDMQQNLILAQVVVMVAGGAVVTGGGLVLVVVVMVVSVGGRWQWLW